MNPDAAEAAAYDAAKRTVGPHALVLSPAPTDATHPHASLSTLVEAAKATAEPVAKESTNA